MSNYVVACCLYPSVEHAEEEERKIRTDGIGHVSNFVKEVDVVGPLIRSLEVTFAPYLILIFLSASLLILKYLRLFATATASPRATRVAVPTTLPSSPWSPLVLDVKAQLWFADQDGIVPVIKFKRL